MIPNTLNLSMDDFLHLIDHDIERGLTGFVSEGNRVRLWETIKREKDRVAGYNREFPSEFRIIVRPQVAFLPCIGHHLCSKMVVEGRAERAHKALSNKKKWKIFPHMQQFRHWFKPVIYMTGS